MDLALEVRVQGSADGRRSEAGEGLCWCWPLLTGKVNLQLHQCHPYLYLLTKVDKESVLTIKLPV